MFRPQHRYRRIAEGCKDVYIYLEAHFNSTLCSIFVSPSLHFAVIETCILEEIYNY
jgi:hypothetical protein